jgi:predicted RNA-binding Zn-ribbon protein involved in translation (DUF1610 family)
MKKIKCPKCGKQVKPEHGRSLKVRVLLTILGFITLGVGWVILMIYDLVKPKYYCPECEKRLHV